MIGALDPENVEFVYPTVICPNGEFGETKVVGSGLDFTIQAKCPSGAAPKLACTSKTHTQPIVVGDGGYKKVGDAVQVTMKCGKPSAQAKTKSEAGGGGGNTVAILGVVAVVGIFAILAWRSQ
jgi:hypothetical protein